MKRFPGAAAHTSWWGRATAFNMEIDESECAPSDDSFLLDGTKFWVRRRDRCAVQEASIFTQVSTAVEIVNRSLVLHERMHACGHELEALAFFWRPYSKSLLSLCMVLENCRKSMRLQQISDILQLDQVWFRGRG